MTITPRLALVVEDDAFQREGLGDLLRGNGFEVIQCESAESAELILARTGLELSLLITDVALAGAANGWELAGFARRQFPHLRIIVVSGERSHRPHPGVLFVEKPWLPNEMQRLTAL